MTGGDGARMTVSERARQSPTREEMEALDIARELVAAGVPVFVAPPATDARGMWDPTGGVKGYVPPRGWQSTLPDLGAMDAWRPGYALAAVGGHGLDVLDVDPRDGGDATAADLASAGLWPMVLGTAATPSGGRHDFVAPLGLRTSASVVGPGVDVRAGLPDGEGRGFVFIAPTVCRSKVDGEVRAYAWTTPPMLDELDHADDSGAALAERVCERQPSRAASTPDAAVEAAPREAPGVPEADRDALDERCAEVGRERLARDLAVLGEVARLAEGEHPRGAGWEDAARVGAWTRLAELVAAPWSGLDLGAVIAAVEGAGWPAPFARRVERKVRGAVERGPKALPSPVQHAAVITEADALAGGVERWSPAVAEAAGRPAHEVRGAAESYDWLRHNVGRGALAGAFERGGELVFTRRVGEEGYRPLDGAREGHESAQVRPLTPVALTARVQSTHRVFVRKKRERNGETVWVEEPAVFPIQAATLLLGAPDVASSVRTLIGTTHTPVVRGDGTVLAAPGYDEATGMLHLPAPGLLVPEVAQAPSRADVAAAVELLRFMLADFAFVSPEDRSNYLGLMVTPLLRNVAEPPYKLGCIEAHQPGSGKSFLARALVTLHGGTERPELPHDDAELSKSLTAVLDTTTAPVVVFDNVSGAVRSSRLAGLLTSPTYTDRRLGTGTHVTVANDRLWIVTGNNVALGGDLARRTLRVRIDPGVPDPESRTGFTIGDFEGWVREHRGELLAALLTIVRAWVVAGRPMPAATSSDSYGAWTRTVAGVLAFAGLGESFDAPATRGASAGEDDAEWSAFLAVAHRLFGEQPWSVRALLEHVDRGDLLPGDVAAARPLTLDDLPQELSDALRPGQPTTALGRRLGKWLSNRAGRWAGGRAVRPAGTDRNGVQRWRIEHHGRAS